MIQYELSHSEKIRIDFRSLKTASKDWKLLMYTTEFKFQACLGLNASSSSSSSSFITFITSADSVQPRTLVFPIGTKDAEK